MIWAYNCHNSCGASLVWGSLLFGLEVNESVDGVSHLLPQMLVPCTGKSFMELGSISVWTWTFAIFKTFNHTQEIRKSKVLIGYSKSSTALAGIIGKAVYCIYCDILELSRLGVAPILKGGGRLYNEE